MSDLAKFPFSGSREERPGDIFFRGIVDRVSFRNEETGFGILRADPEEIQPSGGTTTVVVGLIPANLQTGAHIIARGEWQTHPKFGKQFKARSVTETIPTGKEAIARYLSSGAVKGIGHGLAQRIIDAFGEQALEIMDRNPERLMEISGIGPKKLEEIKALWDEKKNVRETFLFFQTHNISMSLARRIHGQYGDRSIEIVKRNPYILAKDVSGIGFQTADQIASALGILPTSPERVLAGLLYVLRRSSEDGHCYLPPDALMQKAAALLNINDEELIRDALVRAELAADVIRENDRLYLPILFEAEKKLAGHLADRIAHLLDVKATPSQAIIEEFVSQSSLVPGSGEMNAAPKQITLSQQQQEAIRLAAAESLIVITGGPGCGKTTVVRTITRMFRKAGLNVMLAAPTGRAAQRLSEVCEMKASTIHRLLKFDPIKRTFVHDADNKLVLDVLIVDESSMIDLPLAHSLLQAVPASAHLVIVGDADQLPSVGPGLFLADLLAISEVPRVRLNTLFRRADESSITQIAHQINAGTVPDIPEPDGVTKTDAYFLRAESAAEAASLVERLVVEQIPKRFGLQGADITVLTPMNQGEIGVLALNERLQNHLVPAMEGIPRMRVGHLEFRLGDRVCQRVNNYQITEAGVFNGDQGEVIGIDGENKSLIVRLWDGREITYPPETLYQLDLAYVLTIHRSQGSEVPAVILMLHESHSILLERQLLYTAVTRAKKLLIIVGTRKALVLAAKKSRSKRRYTALAEKTRTLLV